MTMLINGAFATTTAASPSSASSTQNIPIIDTENTDIGSKRKRKKNGTDGVLKLKICTRCKSAQSIKEFTKRKKSKDGLNYNCRTCEKKGRPKCAQCLTNPTFGLVMRRPTHCKDHKTVAMIDVINPKCRDCNKHPTFGLHLGKPIYCWDHKLTHMYNVVKKIQCESERCEVTASYGFDRPIFCARHRRNDMGDLISKKCKQSGCDRLTLFAMVGEKAQWCSIHAQAGMIDVHHRQCASSTCTTLACYGLPGHGRKTCAKHKSHGMVYLKYTRCLHDNCSNPCTHGVGFAMWCELHALSTHHNLIERRCADCDQVNILNSENKCDGCGTGYLLVKKISLRKQKEVIAFLDSHPELCDYEFTDQRISVENDFKCTTAHRPDVLWDKITHVVILEIDEFQHSAQNYQCENLRLRAIAECLMRPIIVVRFNPDTFKVDNVLQNIGYVDRYKELAKWLLHAFEPQTVKGVIDVVYLYYNGFSAATAQTNTILDNLE
jgi:hypothetical protein